MFFARATLILILTPFICSVVGFGIGSAIGTAMPEYYRAVFRNPIHDPVAVGQGLGLTQGFGLGVFLSIVLLVLFTWHSRRTLRMEQEQAFTARLNQMEISIHELRQQLASAGKS